MNEEYFSTFVLKISSRCNLNCSYCYVYNRGDNTWKSRSRTMSLSTLSATCDRIREHAIEKQKKSVVIILHGGEPLLVGTKLFKEYLETITQKFSIGDVKVSLGLQTNGILINQEWIDLFEQYRIPLGVSIDGGSEEENSARVDHQGRSSWNALAKSIQLLQANPDAWSRTGFLKVINIEEDPVQVAESIRSLGIKRCDFLQPLVYWKSPYVPDPDAYQATFSNYWVKLVDWWWNQTSDPFLEIRTLMVWGSHLLGVDQNIDSWGSGVSHILTIEADGEYELTDVYKILGDSFPSLGATVHSSKISDLFGTEKLSWMWNQSNNLPQQCKTCEFATACGGGYMPMRFNGTNFNQPSFHCPSIFKGMSRLKKHLQEELKITSSQTPKTMSVS